MNIFKKNLNDGLFKKVEQRIINSLKTTIPSWKKKTYQKIGGTLLLLPLTFLFLWCMLLTGLQHPNFLGFVCFFSAVITGLSFLSLMFKYLSTLINLTPTQKNLQHYGDNSYLYLNAQQKVPEIVLSLTTEEINELFSLPLNASQLEFLEHTIVENKTITIRDLIKLASIKTEEEMSQEQKERMIEIKQSQQSSLQEFLTTHSLNDKYAYQNLLKQSNHLPLEEGKEKSLSSLL